jgi:hypothetical protein
MTACSEGALRQTRGNLASTTMVVIASITSIRHMGTIGMLYAL